VNRCAPNRLQNALAALGEAMHEVNAAIEEMRKEHDPLAVHIFVSRRNYRNVHDTKAGKRRDTLALLGWQSACDLGFRGRSANGSDLWVRRPSGEGAFVEVLRYRNAILLFPGWVAEG